MCCGRLCCCIMLLVLVAIAIGFVFGFGVYKDGFHKIKNTFHEGYVCNPKFESCGRPFLGHAAPPF